jgi:hypothetical protein
MTRAVLRLRHCEKVRREDRCGRRRALYNQSTVHVTFTLIVWFVRLRRHVVVSTYERMLTLLKQFL